MEGKFQREAHVRFIDGLEKQDDTFEHWASEHLKLSAVYWAMTSLDLMGVLPEGERRELVLQFVLKCRSKEEDAFGGNVGHDPHLLYTLSAVQLLVLFDALHLIDCDKVARKIASLQQTDGSFVGDKWGEKDTRFSYIAIMGLTLLGKLDLIDVDKAVEFIMRCKNFDEAFGAVPDAESHAGQTFCCVGALAIVKKLHLLDREKLGWWLCERQLACGGLNGRPEKKEDVCYSWWVLSALELLDCTTWIDGEKLVEFILACQDDVDGGISDRPENLADVFHLFFGICGLSILQKTTNHKFNLKIIDPSFALPTDRVAKKE